MRIISFLSLALLPLFSVSITYANTEQPLENIALSCGLISKNPNDPVIIKCLKNADNLIKKEVNARLIKLSTKDREATLNKKGLNVELVKYSCEQTSNNAIVKQECLTQANLSLLLYLKDRF